MYEYIIIQANAMIHSCDFLVYSGSAFKYINRATNILIVSSFYLRVDFKTY